MQGFRSLLPVLGLTLLFTCPALAADAPVIASVTPATGPVSGNVKVTITGSNLDAKIVCIVPCPTRVFFGDAEASVREVSDSAVTAIAPAHAAGTVDVVLTTSDGRTATARNAFTYQATAESGYQMVLLPVYLDSEIPGVNGSRWNTDLWIRNNGAASAALAPWPCPAGQACPAVFPLTYTLQPGESVHNLPVGIRPVGAPPARLLYVAPAAASDVSFNLRVYDSSRASVNGGTELPVVRDKDFRTTTTNLLNVPLNVRFRHTLRIYEMMDAPSGTLPSSAFQVRIYSLEPGNKATLLADKTVITIATQTGAFRDAPGYGQIADLTQGLFNFGDGTAALRVEIEPLTAGSRFWAMDSVTNNDTQQITLVTPQ